MNPWQKAEIEQRGAPAVLPAYPDWTFTVRRYSGWLPSLQRAMARIAAQPDVADYLERQKAEGYTPNEADQILDGRMIRDAFAEGCIAGWDGVTGPDGAPFPFSRENACTLLGHFPDIYSELQKFSSEAANYKPLTDAAKVALASGNS